MPSEQTTVAATTSELISRLEDSRRSLMNAITGLDDTAFRARTGAGGWTPAEVLAHLLATEAVSTERARLVLTQDDPSVRWRPDEELENEARNAQRMPVPQIVHGLLALRRDVMTLLEPLSADQLARPYHQERRGELTLGWLFARMAEHESEHAGQIAALRAGASSA
jgi:uncharacterized damage-inducible protein DinB